MMQPTELIAARRHTIVDDTKPSDGRQNASGTMRDKMAEERRDRKVHRKVLSDARGAKPSQNYSATSYDVARQAGVSQSAVSRCFRPGASVAPATRERILAAAAALHYQPNALAQALISGRTNLVAVLISNLTNLYYPEVLAELVDRLATKGLRTLLFALPKESEVGEALGELWRHRVDGAIAAVHLSDEQIGAFREREVALVLYNRISQGEPAASVCCDSMAGERTLVDRLLQSGHKRFGVIAGPKDSFVGEERARGALERLAEAGFAKVPVARGEFSWESGRRALSELLERNPNLDAIVSANDVMAIGAIDAARDVHGLRVPGDISIVGFDGVDPARWSSYQLTSIRQPVRRMTDAAVQMLIDRIEELDLPAERRLFAGQFIEGGSARLV